MMKDASARRPSLAQSLIPIIFLIALLTASVYIFDDSSSGGPNQIALILSAGVGSLIGIRNGFTWKVIQEGMVKGISLSTGAMLILLVVGSLIGTWILAGIVPTMIYYGLLILHPSIFFVACCVICAIISLVTGSSWTTAGTIGVALIGIAGALGLNVGVAAGAIISGAYFGDKLSPMSDTTNLAPAVAGTDLFTHIRHMLWTTVPSIIIALIIFAAIGVFSTGTGNAGNLSPILSAIEGSFNVAWYLLVPPVLVVGLVIKRMPAFPALLIGSLLGAIFAVLFQQPVVLQYADSADLPVFLALIKGAWMSLFQGYTAATGNAELDQLLTRGGMGSMLPVVWLIMSAMMFGGVMETTGMLPRIAESILTWVRSSGSLIASTVGTAIGTNIIASDQYMAIILPGRMFREEFQRRGLAPKNLSRALEDSGTLTSPLIPWNTCGAFMAGSLGVSTMAYMPFAFFNMFNPCISILYGFTGFSIARLDEEEAGGDMTEAEAV